jgi:hypothetical protein
MTWWRNKKTGKIWTQQDGLTLLPLGWKDEHEVVNIEHMQRARDFARAAIRPSTLAAEFSTSERAVTKDEVVEAIAKALLPFVEKREKR